MLRPTVWRYLVPAVGRWFRYTGYGRPGGVPEWLIGAVSAVRPPVGRNLLYVFWPRVCEMPYTVYVLRSQRDGRLYTGVTDNVARRVAQHNRGNVRSTARRRPLELVYSEEFESKARALDRERSFKTPEGGVLKQRLARGKESDKLDT